MGVFAIQTVAGDKRETDFFLQDTVFAPEPENVVLETHLGAEDQPLPPPPATAKVPKGKGMQPESHPRPCAFACGCLVMGSQLFASDGEAMMSLGL